MQLTLLDVRSEVVVREAPTDAALMRFSTMRKSKFNRVFAYSKIETKKIKEN